MRTIEAPILRPRVDTRRDAPSAPNSKRRGDFPSRHLAFAGQNIAPHQGSKPLSEHFIEDALGTPWPVVRTKADPLAVDHLIRVFAGLGLGLRDDVFGVVKPRYTRFATAPGSDPLVAFMTLAAHLPKAQLRLAIQEAPSGQKAQAAVLVIQPDHRFLLCDSPEVAPDELVGQLFGHCLQRLAVAEQRIASLSSLSAEEAIVRLLAIDVRPALRLSKSRVMDLLDKEDQ